jgi:hypothetical protein
VLCRALVHRLGNLFVAVSLVSEHKARCKMGDSDSGEDYEEDERIVKLVEKIGKEEAAEEVVKYLKEELGGKNGMVRGYLPPAAASCIISMRCAALIYAAVSRSRSPLTPGVRRNVLQRKRCYEPLSHHVRL